MGGYGSDYSYDTSDDIVKKSAKSYNIDKGRSYMESKAAVPPPRGKHLITEAKFPIIVAVDVTGSMREFPGIIFEKLWMSQNIITFSTRRILFIIITWNYIIYNTNKKNNL